MRGCNYGYARLFSQSRRVAPYVFSQRPSTVCVSPFQGEKCSPKDRDLGPLMKDYPARKIHMKSSPFRPLIKENTKDNRIAVHDLPEDACEASLIEMFKVFGTLSKVRIAKDGSTGMLTGITHVSYENIDDAERALNQLTEEGFESMWYVPVE